MKFLVGSFSIFNFKFSIECYEKDIICFRDDFGVGFL